jgi:hypothetical protein
MPETRPAYEDDQAAQRTTAAGWESRRAFLGSLISTTQEDIKSLETGIAAGLYEDHKTYGAGGTALARSELDGFRAALARAKHELALRVSLASEDSPVRKAAGLCLLEALTADGQGHTKLGIARKTLYRPYGEPPR